MTKANSSEDGSFVFQLEVMLSAPNNGVALEQLLRALNQGKFTDYRILSGIELGATIKKAVKESTRSPIPVEKNDSNSLESRIEKFIISNQLIRLNINKGRGIKINMPCRIVNFDHANSLLTVYHVDEKQVYTVRMNEIDDFVE
ncbi:MAG: hypothetical protein P0Y55_04235 [Candidatus Cohnella colombiensis]|uniref:Uncharacterized protein n=1 Tax=Candidatus Cohnella colombiensis TaxID=3121368 RepID=A0AA95F5L0_9BACL|nr:MAG: hypothetical protein P0Y55_04235 [Cohnella sp.]